MAYFMETYKSGKGWGRDAEPLSGLTELLADSKPAMRIVDEIGNVVARNRAAGFVEEAVKALAEKAKAAAKKPPTPKLRAEMQVIVKASGFHVILNDGFKRNRVLNVAMPSGRWQEGFAAGRALIASHGRGSLYAIAGAREIHVDESFTIEAIEKFVALNPEGTSHA